MASGDGKVETGKQHGGGRRVTAVIAAIIIVALVAFAATRLLGGAGADEGQQQPAQAVQPSESDVSQAKDDIEKLKPLVTETLDQASAEKLVAALPLSNRAPQVAVDASAHSLTVTFSQLEGSSNGSVDTSAQDRDLLYDAVAAFTCLEGLQQVSFTAPGAETYTLRRSEIEQSFGQPLNATGALTQDAWAEILRKLGTQNFVAGLMGLSTASGKQMAGAAASGSGVSADASGSASAPAAN